MRPAGSPTALLQLGATCARAFLCVAELQPRLLLKAQHLRRTEQCFWMTAGDPPGLATQHVHTLQRLTAQRDSRVSIPKSAFPCQFLFWLLFLRQANNATADYKYTGWLCPGASLTYGSVFSQKLWI